MKKYKGIIIITASYPHGDRETYFENELRFLEKHFEDIFIWPVYNPYKLLSEREVSNKVTVLPVLLENGWKRVYMALRHFRLSSAHFRDLFRFSVYLSRPKLKKWLNSLFLLNSFRSHWPSFQKKYNITPQDFVIYPYWANAPYFLLDEIKSYKKAVRLHGGDFYLERNNGFLPLRQEIYSAANIFLPISNDIANRLESDYGVDNNRIVTSYLGVHNTQTTCALKVDPNTVYVCSCSHVYGLKRVHLIFDILKAVKKSLKIVWHHYGGGELLEELKLYVSQHEVENMQIHFAGHLNQEQLKVAYECNYYDWFINTSEYEGLPVSIMEAFSFGIPAIATDVGGVSEIVNSKNGRLIPKNIEVEKVAAYIEATRGGEYLNKRREAYDTWCSLFNADENYAVLLNTLSKL